MFTNNNVSYVLVCMCQREDDLNEGVCVCKISRMKEEEEEEDSCVVGVDFCLDSLPGDREGDGQGTSWLVCSAGGGEDDLAGITRLVVQGSLSHSLTSFPHLQGFVHSAPSRPGWWVGCRRFFWLGYLQICPVSQETTCHCWGITTQGTSVLW